MQRSAPDRDQGFVLVVVLLGLVVLGGAVATFSASLRSHAREAAAEFARAEAESLADAGVNLALLDVLSAREDLRHARRFAINGGAVACREGGHVIEVAVSDETSRIDVNAASEETLAALFGGAGATPGDARRMAQSVMDYRDADSATRPVGAEAAEYRAAGLPYGPRNTPFQAVEEMGRMLGMDQRLLERITPSLTVHGGQPGIDPDGAPPELLAMLLAGEGSSARLPNDTAGLRAAFRRQMPQHVAIAGRQRFLLRSTARGRATFTREVVVELVSSRSRTHAIRVWRQGSAEPAQEGLAALAGSC